MFGYIFKRNTITLENTPIPLFEESLSSLLFGVSLEIMALTNHASLTFLSLAISHSWHTGTAPYLHWYIQECMYFSPSLPLQWSACGTWSVHLQQPTAVEWGSCYLKDANTNMHYTAVKNTFTTYLGDSSFSAGIKIVPGPLCLLCYSGLHLYLGQRILYTILHTLGYTTRNLWKYILFENICKRELP